MKPKMTDILRLIAVSLCLTATRSYAQQTNTSQAIKPTATPVQVPLDPFLDEEDSAPIYPIVVNVKFHLNDEKLGEYLTKLALRETPCQIQNCNFSLIDIANTLQLSRFTSNDLAEAIARLKVSPIDFYNIFILYDVNSTSMEQLLQTFGLSFSEIYNNFVKTLSNPSQTIPEILRILNVDVLDFMNAQAYGNDSVKLQVLFTGNYSRDNIQAVLTTINQTGVDLLKAIPLNLVASRLNNIDHLAFRNFVKNLGITTKDLLAFYDYLNLTVIHFLADARFIKVVTDHYEILNPDEVIGVIVSQNIVFTANKAESLRTFQTQNTDLVRNYTSYVAELVENPVVQYSVKNVILKVPEYVNENIAIVAIRNTFPLNFTEISQHYNSSELSNCTYISRYPFGGLYVENFARIALTNHEMNLTKSNATVYNIGSPLFCQDKLYGIAIEEHDNIIQFATFLKKSPEIQPPTGQQTTIPSIENITSSNNDTISENNSANHILNFNMIYLILALITLRYAY